MTPVFEGSIIRIMRRLEGSSLCIGCSGCVVGNMAVVSVELLRQMRSAAVSIGNTPLLEKFEEGSKLLKHGIIFAGSLYL